AAIVGYGLDAAERGLSDVDLLVPPERAREVLDILVGDGWLMEHRQGLAFTRDVLMGRHKGWAFDRPPNAHVDVHWCMLQQARWAGVDDLAWRTARPGTLNGRSVLVPDDTHLLLHGCVHAGFANGGQAVGWATDAMLVLRRGAVDWPLLTALAEERALTIPVAAALGYLRDALEAPVPDDLLRRLQAVAVPAVLQREQRALAVDPGRRSRAQRRAIVVGDAYRHRERPAVFRPSGVARRRRLVPLRWWL